MLLQVPDAPHSQRGVQAGEQVEPFASGMRQIEQEEVVVRGRSRFPTV